MITLHRIHPMRNTLHRLALAGSPARIASSLAALALATTPARSQVIPGGDFQLYQPGSTTVTAELVGGGVYVPWNPPNAPTNLTVLGGSAAYSDSTTGSTVDLPGWSKIQGNVDLAYSGPGGSMALGAYAAWGGDTRVETTGSLYTIAAGETIIISVNVSGGPGGPMAGPLAFHLYANGALVTPSSSVNVSGEANKTISRTYDPAALLAHVGQPTRIVLGVENANDAGGRVIFDNVTLTAGVDLTPPTLNSFVDDQGGGPVLEYRPVIYTLTFSEAMKASSIDATDFENASATAITINSVTPTVDPAVFQVSVTPTAAGTLRLQVKAGAVIEDAAGVGLVTSPALQDDTLIAVDADTTAPTLNSVVDNKGGGPVVLNQTVTYTLTFSEAMNASTLEAADFENASFPTPTTIGSVSPTANPAVFLIEATPTAAGTLQLQIKAGANLTDLKGLALDTGSPVPDDNTIIVNAPPTLVCPLGVLNLTANGGINPATGNLWQAGDKYRLIFVTSGTTTCNSTDIVTYNTFVQGLANASTAFPALGSVTWKVVGSTAAVAATDNTGTNPGVNGVGEPVFRMDGSFAIANNYADLWNGINNSHVTGQNYLSVHLDENGVVRTDERVRTGSSGIGTATGDGRVLGGSAEATPRVQTGRNFAPDFYGGLGGNGWMADWSEEAASAGRVYAMSAPITLQGTPGNTFTAWADANDATGQTPDQDHDNDGVKNGIEYFMGETGSSFTAMPGLDGTNTVTWPMDPTFNGTYEVQTSPNLGTWTNVDPRPAPSGGNLSYLLPTGLGKQFVRLLVTPTP